MRGILYFCLSTGNPQALINTLWLNMNVQFGLTGRHEHLQMLWSDLQLNVDSAGREYLEFNERATKTRPGNSRDTRPFKPKMFATGTVYDYLLSCEIFLYLKLLPNGTVGTNQSKGSKPTSVGVTSKICRLYCTGHTNIVIQAIHAKTHWVRVMVRVMVRV
jgi:hypothetical protein